MPASDALPKTDGPQGPQRHISSFGRRRGKPLRTSKQALYDTLLPEITIDATGEGALDVARIFPDKKAVWLEIGFGGGEHLAHQATLNPDVGIIGCEPYVNGIAGLLTHIDQHQLSNIRIHTDDARPLAERFPDASIERVFVLYPDPWPKTRHHKRRIIEPGFLDTLVRIMKPGAQLRLATDSAEYCSWMLAHMSAHGKFRWQAKEAADWLNPPSDWISTRYEQKALAGRPTYLNFTRR